MALLQTFIGIKIRIRINNSSNNNKINNNNSIIIYMIINNNSNSLYKILTYNNNSKWAWGPHSIINKEGVWAWEWGWVCQGVNGGYESLLKPNKQWDVAVKVADLEPVVWDVEPDDEHAEWGLKGCVR